MTTVFDMSHADSVIRESSVCPALMSRMGSGGNQVPLVLYNTALAFGVAKEEPVCKTRCAQFDNQTDSPVVLMDQGGAFMHVEFGKTGTLTSKMQGHAPLVMSVHENQRAEVRVSGVSNAITQPGGKPGQGNPVVFIQEKNEMVVAPTLTASNDPSRSPQSAEVTAQIAAVYEAAFSLAENTIGRKPENGGNGTGFKADISYTLNATGVHGVSTPRAAVRRLTPVECERLQGFPDNWTRIPYRGKSAENCPDSPRYKAIGNSWAVPCVRWIGERIQKQLEGENK